MTQNGRVRRSLRRDDEFGIHLAHHEPVDALSARPSLRCGTA
jgi:hypothetical protein